MIGLGIFLTVLLVLALLSRPLSSHSVTPQMVVMAAGLGLALLRPDDKAAVVDAEALRFIGELALVMALFVDASRSDVIAFVDRRCCRSASWPSVCR